MVGPQSDDDAVSSNICWRRVCWFLCLLFRAWCISSVSVSCSFSDSSCVVGPPVLSRAPRTPSSSSGSPYPPPRSAPLRPPRSERPPHHHPVTKRRWRLPPPPRRSTKEGGGGGCCGDSSSRSASSLCVCWRSLVK